jgi:hypothetical protein
MAGVANGQVRAPLDTEGLPAYLRDRGTGVSASQFGTYVQKHQLIVYPFFEYYENKDEEYDPSELGRTQEADYRGEYEAEEWLLFLAYGFSDRFIAEFEIAVIDAELETALDDDSGLPDEISESGLGDVEGQLRWRWSPETQSRPEFFSFFETVFPSTDEGSLIGTTDWEFKLGVGAIRGYSWGTVTARLAVEYDTAEGSGGMGEAAIEYLKRLSSHWRVFTAFEGTQDEVEYIAEVQWFFVPTVCLKLNTAFGVTSKAADWAPEVGVMFNFGL